MGPMLMLKILLVSTDCSVWYLNVQQQSERGDSMVESMLDPPVASQMDVDNIDFFMLSPFILQIISLETQKGSESLVWKIWMGLIVLLVWKMPVGRAKALLHR